MKMLLTALLLALPAGGALAYHPLIGEDTLFLGRDGRQIEGGLDYTASDAAGPKRYSTTATAVLTYGLWDGLDVLVTVPWQGWSSRGISESGLGDVLLEAKFRACARKGWTLALKPGFSMPAGSESKSLGAGKGGVWVYGIAGRTAGPWEFYLNAGYLYNRNDLDERENILNGSAAAVLEVLPRLRAAAELSGHTSLVKTSSSHPLYGLFGLIWSPYPTLDLDAGVRLGLDRGADDLGLLGGITLRL